MNSQSVRAHTNHLDDYLHEPMDTRLAFCRALKAARKRRGLTLDDIAGVTKVCASYFEALERGDLRRWPKAIFRRAFFRGYVEMIGVPVAETLEEFARLFPDDGREPAPVAAKGPEPTLRLVLDPSWRGAKIEVRSRVIAAIISFLQGLDDWLRPQRVSQPARGEDDRQRGGDAEGHQGEDPEEHRAGVDDPWADQPRALHVK